MSKLTHHVAKNGLPIFKLDQRSMCSSYAPDVEARRWVEANQDLVRSAEVCFILGLGCGYHCSEMAASFPEISFIVIEQNVEVTNWFWKNTIRQVENLSVTTMVDTTKPESWLPFASDLKRPYAVTLHVPSLQISKGFFGAARDFLLARGFESYNKQRSLSAHHADLLPEIGKVPEGFGVNIRNIREAIDPVESESYYEHVWDTLGELLK